MNEARRKVIQACLQTICNDPENSREDILEALNKIGQDVAELIVKLQFNIN